MQQFAGAAVILAVAIQVGEREISRDLDDLEVL